MILEAAVLDTINKRIDDQTKLMESCTDNIKANLDEMRTFLVTWDTEREARLTRLEADFKNELTCCNERTEKKLKDVNERVDDCAAFKRRVITVGQVIGALFAVAVTMIGLVQRW
jgi:hypothetical protein